MDMKLIARYGYALLCGSLLWFAVGCGGDESRTGEDAGEVNHENPVQEKQDETGDGFTRQKNNGAGDAEEGGEPGPGADTTNTDSTQVTPRMQRKQ